MTAEKVEHIKASDVSLLTKPDLLSYRGGEHPWHVRSERGEVSAEGDEVLLVVVPAHHDEGLSIGEVGADVRDDDLLVEQVRVLADVLDGVLDEVDEDGVPEPGRVRDAFGPQLPQFVHLLGGQVDAVHRVGDDREQMLERLTGSAVGAESVLDSRAQLIITTGGTGRSTAPPSAATSSTSSTSPSGSIASTWWR